VADQDTESDRIRPVWYGSCDFPQLGNEALFDPSGASTTHEQGQR